VMLICERDEPVQKTRQKMSRLLSWDIQVDSSMRASFNRTCSFFMMGSDCFIFIAFSAVYRKTPVR
jgi:hypothetical protein